MKTRHILVLGTLMLSLGLQAQDGKKHFAWIDGFHKTDARREINIPDILGYRTLKGDFHMHTIFSDGSVLPAERVHEAWREGLDVIAITDHTTPQPKHVVADYSTSWKMARGAAQRRGITLIQATEYTKSEPLGHMNIFFTRDANYYAARALDPDSAMHHAAAEQAMVILNHPGWPDKNSDLDPFHVRHMTQKNIRGIEVINGNEFYPAAMDYCYTWNLAPFSNTDAHSPIQTSYDVEQGRRNITLLFAADNSEAAVQEALLAGRTVATAGDLLVGRPEYLRALLLESLQVSRLELGEFEFSCQVTNISDITWTLDGPGFRRFVFPARRTVQLGELVADAELVYQVSHTWINANDHLEMPLTFLLTARDEVLMPFIRQNLTLIPPQEKITISSLTPGAEVRYTLDGSIPDANSALYQAPLQLKNSAMLTVRGFKPGMKPSRSLSRQVLIAAPHPAQPVKPGGRGLGYRYYEGNLLSVAEIAAKGTLRRSGTTATPDVTLATAEDHFGLIFTGYLDVPASGLYHFAVESDDGAVLHISGVQLLNNDGSHSTKRVSGAINLKKGLHPLEILYFDDYDEQELRIYWTIPGQPERQIEPKYYFTRP